MKKLILAIAFLGLMAGDARAGATLGTSNPAGKPLVTSAGTVSGPMLMNVVSNNPPNDILAAWSITLAILPQGGASGTLTFQDPATGMPPNPPNYIFGANGLGIAATNAGSMLSANDFFDPSVGPGVAVPGTPGANVLQMDFLVSSNASGLFGVYAREGAAATQWTDSNFNTQFFTNVPDGTGMVLIGDVLILASAVPEPSAIVLLALGCTALAAWRWRRKRSKRDGIGTKFAATTCIGRKDMTRRQSPDVSLSL
jgi:PEP-CTERM motif